MGSRIGNLDETQPLELVNPIWSDRRSSNLVKWLMQRSGLSTEMMADFLGVKTSVFSNKLSRGAFSFHELLIAAYACNYSFLLSSNDCEIARRFDLGDELGEDSQEWKRVTKLKQRLSIEDKRSLLRSKEMELDKIQADLMLLKEEIGNADSN